jgi:hypothetical protein
MDAFDWIVFGGLMLIILPGLKDINDRLSGRKNFHD